jgi:hypothetical protein
LTGEDRAKGLEVKVPRHRIRVELSFPQKDLKGPGDRGSGEVVSSKNISPTFEGGLKPTPPILTVLEKVPSLGFYKLFHITCPIRGRHHRITTIAREFHIPHTERDHLIRSNRLGKLSWIRTGTSQYILEAGRGVSPLRDKHEPALMGIPPDLPSVGAISPDPRPEEAIPRTGCTPKKVEVILEEVGKIRGSRA